MTLKMFLLVVCPLNLRVFRRLSKYVILFSYRTMIKEFAFKRREVFFLTNELIMVDVNVDVAKVIKILLLVTLYTYQKTDIS